MIIPVGTLVNAGAIAVGGLCGLALGARVPDRVRTIMFQAIGLCTLVLGMSMALGTKQLMAVFGSILIGAVAGELLRLEDRFVNLGNRLKERLRGSNPEFTNGLVSATMLFCIGSMAILGPFDEALRGDRTLIFTKSIMDGFTAMALASAYGFAIILSIVPLLIYQGCLTVFAGYLLPLLPDPVMNELAAVGGFLIIGIGISILKLKNIPLTNFLPSLVVVVILTHLVL